MASTYSNLKIELITTGEQTNTWGSTTNTNLGTAIEEAIVGSADVTFSSANVTLTLSNSNSSQTARNLRLNLTGTSGGARTLTVPNIEKNYIVNNGLADTVTVQNSTGTTVAVPAGKTMWVYSTGTGIKDVTTHLTSLTLGSSLPIASGGTGATSFTANNVLLGNGSSAFQVVAPGTAGNVLTSNGTTWTSSSLSSTYTPQTRNISTGTGLSGGGNLTADRTLSIANTGVSAGTYGSASTIPQIVVNAQGQITSASNVAVSQPWNINNSGSSIGDGTTWNIPANTVLVMGTCYHAMSGNVGSRMSVQIKNSSGTVLFTYDLTGGNENNGTDGGSGMSARSAWSVGIPSAAAGGSLYFYRSSGSGSFSGAVNQYVTSA